MSQSHAEISLSLMPINVIKEVIDKLPLCHRYNLSSASKDFYNFIVKNDEFKHRMVINERTVCVKAYFRKDNNLINILNNLKG